MPDGNIKRMVCYNNAEILSKIKDGEEVVISYNFVFSKWVVHYTDNEEDDYE